MKNFSGITDNLDITTKKYVDDGLASKANLAGNNTFTGGQTITGANAGYSVNASGYVKGSWLQSSITDINGANGGHASNGTGRVCVFDGAGWIYYRTPAEILAEAGGAKASDIPTNYVTTNTAQDITAEKKFLNTLIVGAKDDGSTGFKVIQGDVAGGDTLFTVNINGIDLDAHEHNIPLLIGGNAGTSGQVLTSQGAGKAPMWGDITTHGYTELTNENLDTITEAGWYRAAQNNSCTNKPSGIYDYGFILFVEKGTDAHIKQTISYIAYAGNCYYETYSRQSFNAGSTWPVWLLLQPMSDTYPQTFSGRKTFSSGINLKSSLQVNGSNGTAGQVLTSTGDGVPVWKDMGGSADIMPTIRLVSIADTAGTCICSAANPLRFSFVVEKGTLLPTDEVQLCSRQLFTYKKGHMLYPGGTIVHGRTYKLRSFLSRGISTITQINGYYVFEINNYPELREFVRSNMGAGEHSTLIKYLRISRNPGSNVGNRLFSNVIPIYVAPSAPNSTTQTVKIRIR